LDWELGGEADGDDDWKMDGCGSEMVSLDMICMV
jgi:hypothetical protein